MIEDGFSEERNGGIAEISGMKVPMAASFTGTLQVRALFRAALQ